MVNACGRCRRKRQIHFVAIFIEKARIYMKVYVITEGIYSDYRIVGVSLDRKTADAVAEAWKDGE